MTTIAEYLKKLLYQYDCVVVPALGGFLTQHQPAQFELASATDPVWQSVMRSGAGSASVVAVSVEAGAGRFMPPRKRLAFNEVLRLDDGILVNYVMLHESLTREAAQRKIGWFVAEVQERIRRTGSYTLDGIGMLTQNEEGRFQFEPTLRQNFLGESYGMPVINAVSGANSLPVSMSATDTNPGVIQIFQPVVNAPLALPVAAGLISPSLVEGIEEPEVEEVLAEDDSETRPLWTRRSAGRWAAAAAVVGVLGIGGYLFGTGTGQFQQGSLSPDKLLTIPASVSAFVQDVFARLNPPASTLPAPANVPDKPTISVQPVDKKLITIPVAVAKPVVAAPKADHADWKKPVQPVVIASVAVSAVEGKAIIPAEVKAGPMARVAVAPRAVNAHKRSSAWHYVVIAGSFANYANAVRLRRTLRNAGYADAYIIPPTAKSVLHKVAAFGSYNPDEIPAAAEKIGALTGTPGWIFTHR